jgi:hypothetical protein
MIRKNLLFTGYISIIIVDLSLDTDIPVAMQADKWVT